MTELGFPTKAQLARLRARMQTQPPIYTYYYLLSKIFNRSGGEHTLDYVFVLSTGRCGTNTLASLFELSKQVLAFHEPQPQLGKLSRQAYEQYPDIPNAILGTSFLLARQNLFQASQLSGKHYIETSHYNTFLAPVIAEILPNARFIHLVRHPVDVVLSAVQRKWYLDNPDDVMRIRPRRDSQVPWDEYNILQKNAWSWAETNQWIIDFCRTLPDEQYHLIHAEDMFAGRAETITQLYDFTQIMEPAENRIQRILGKKLNANPQKRSNNKVVDGADAIWTIVGSVASQLGYSRIAKEVE